MRSYGGKLTETEYNLNIFASNGTTVGITLDWRFFYFGFTNIIIGGSKCCLTKQVCQVAKFGGYESG